jgi:hypothetical protein
MEGKSVPDFRVTKTFHPCHYVPDLSVAQEF